MKKNYYQILGLTQDAGLDDIRSAYLELVKKYHPDRNPNDRNAEEKFKKVAESYAVLSDQKQKEMYDLTLVLEAPVNRNHSYIRSTNFFDNRSRFGFDMNKSFFPNSAVVDIDSEKKKVELQNNMIQLINEYEVLLQDPINNTERIKNFDEYSFKILFGVELPQSHLQFLDNFKFDTFYQVHLRTKQENNTENVFYIVGLVVVVVIIIVLIYLAYQAYLWLF